MFGVGMQEVIVILVVALIVIGPKKLPDLARALGRAIGEFKRAADDLKDDLDINGLKDERDRLLRDIRESKASKSAAAPPSDLQPSVKTEILEREDKS